MNIAQWRTQLGRLFGLAAFGCGIVGLVLGIVERNWRLGITGWLTGGALLALLAITLMLDEYLDSREVSPP